MKKILAIILTLIFCSCLISCNNEEPIAGKRPIYGEYVHPDFETQYTIEEHMERLSKIASKTLKLKNFKVSIVYAFYDFDAEYFLIEYETEEYEYDVHISQMATYNPFYPPKQDLWQEVLIKETATSGYILGYIYEDNYYYGLLINQRHYGGIYCGSVQQYTRGQSPYKAYGYEDNVKYYGGQIAAVACEEGLKIVACEDCFKMDVGFELIKNGKYTHEGCRVGELLTMEECEKLMKDNRKARFFMGTGLLKMPKEENT